VRKIKERIWLHLKISFEAVLLSLIYIQKIRDIRIVRAIRDCLFSLWYVSVAYVAYEDLW